MELSYTTVTKTQTQGQPKNGKFRKTSRGDVWGTAGVFDAHGCRSIVLCYTTTTKKQTRGKTERLTKHIVTYERSKLIAVC
jgi:hypothetical protein